MKGWRVAVEPSAGRWRCRWRGKYGIGQETFWYKADAREKAEQKRRNFERQDAGLPPLPESERVRLADASRAYLELRSKNPRHNTFIKDRQAVDQFSQHAGDPALQDIVQSGVYAFKDWLYTEKGYGHSTVRMRLSHLRTFFKWCLQRGWIPANPAEGVEMPPTQRPGRVLTPDEVQSVYAIPPVYVVRAFTLLLNSGMRKAEVIELRKSQVERGDPWVVHFEARGTKNNKPKAVVLNDAAREAVEASMAGSKTEKVFDGVTEDVLDYWMRRVQEKIGPVRLHDFKHTFCTHWMRETGDIYGLQQMTGNSLESLRIYTHLTRGTPRGMAKFSGFRPNGALVDGSLSV